MFPEPVDVEDTTTDAVLLTHRSGVSTMSKTRPKKTLPSRGKAIGPRHGRARLCGKIIPSFPRRVFYAVVRHSKHISVQRRVQGVQWMCWLGLKQ